MVEQSGSESVAVRFGTYIDELREFFTSRQVQFGSPDDVVGFAERVAPPGPFQDEMGSLVRSIVFRENEALGRGELLELVAVAVGGPEVETAAQEMHASVRQVFVFVNNALRQHRRIPEEMNAATEQPVTAGDILAASGKKQAEEEAVAERTPENVPDPNVPAQPAQAAEDRRRVFPAGGVLSAAAEKAEQDRAQRDARGDEDPERNELNEDEEPAEAPRPWLVPAVVLLLGVVGVGAYVLRSPNGTGMAAHGTSDAGSFYTSGSPSTQARPVSADACVGPTAAGVSRATLEERSRFAHTLLEQKLYESALPELRDIARLDPGFPGVNLDESDALLQMKRPDEAREAVDTQIAVSECLSKLPTASLDAYCSAQFSSSTVSGCRPQLAHIRQSAELQAALVHLELGHRASPDAGGTDAASGSGRSAGTENATATAGEGRSMAEPAGVPRMQHRVVLPPASPGDTTVPETERPRTVVTGHAPTAPRPAAHKSSGDDSLIHGEGTDSSLGAYSKPQ